MKPRRKKLSKLTIEETSAVDSPAQKPALAVILKAATDNELLTDEAWDVAKKRYKVNEKETREEFVRRLMDDGDFLGDEEDSSKRETEAKRLFDEQKGGKLEKAEKTVAFTDSIDGHQHALVAYEYDGEYRHFELSRAGDDERMHSHEIMRTADGAFVISENMGHTHTIKTMAAPMMMAPMQKQGAKKVEQSEILEVVRKALTLTAEQRGYYERLSDVERVAFLDKTPSERQTEFAEFQKSDPVVYTDESNTEYRASDDPRLVQKARQADQTAREVAELRKAAEGAVYKERARELGTLPGTEAEIVTLLKAIDAIEDQAAREKSIEILKSKAAANAPAFEPKGVAVTKADDGSEVVTKQDAVQAFENIVQKHMKDNNIPHTDYYKTYNELAVRPEHKELVTFASRGKR